MIGALSCVHRFVELTIRLCRGTDTIKIFLWLEKLRSQARNAGGDVISHLGNHEWMNMLGAHSIVISPRLPLSSYSITQLTGGKFI